MDGTAVAQLPVASCAAQSFGEVAGPGQIFCASAATFARIAASTPSARSAGKSAQMYSGTICSLEHAARVYVGFHSPHEVAALGIVDHHAVG